ncbi:MAG: pilus assembly protein TadG-related protein [Chloroflexia bacterium]
MRNKIGRAEDATWGERHVDLDRYLSEYAVGRAASRARAVPSGRVARRVERPRSKGQALLIIALMMTVLILFVGLGVDVGNLMGKRAKLQSAVDSASLSGAQLLTGSVLTSTVQAKAYQILEANGVPTSTLSTKIVEVNQGLRQVRVRAVQRVDTYFMRLIPLWRTVEVSAEATADLNSFAEMNIKPYGQAGVVNELMLQTWGTYSWRRGGDAYSPLYNAEFGPTYPNEEYPNQPYGYLFRIDVPPSFPDDELVIQFFDPDTTNKSTDMPTPTTMPNQPPWPTPPYPNTPTPHAYDPTFFRCSQSSQTCTANDVDSTNPALRLDGYIHTNWNTAWTTGRTSVWRVDEYRQFHNDPGGISPSYVDEYDAAWVTETNFSLWHFDPRITSAFGVPEQMSDQPGGASVVTTYTARYSPDPVTGNHTDLAWFEPWAPIKLNDPACSGYSGSDCFERESNGNFYFYLYVKSTNGSSENDYDIRVGPKDLNYAEGYECRTLAAWSTSNPDVCFPNEQFYRQRQNSGFSGSYVPEDWNDGGAKVFAKRALPLNLASGLAFPMLYTQVSEKAAGQTLAIKHFDQDCEDCTAAASDYQMQYCVNAGTTNLCSTGNCEPCSSLLNPNCFGDIGDAYRGPNNRWWCPACPQPEQVQIPIEGTQAYTNFFGPNSECESSWLRLEQNLSYSNDTTVWEMPYRRPRLIK